MVDISGFRQALTAVVEEILADSAPQPTNASSSALHTIVRLTVPAAISVEWLLALTDGNTPYKNEYFWSVPDDGLYMAGFGIEAEMVAEGENRFETIENQKKAFRLSEKLMSTVEYQLPPVWFGGYSFDPGRRGFPWNQWPDARFVLPRWQFVAGQEGSVTFQTVFEPRGVGVVSDHPRNTDSLDKTARELVETAVEELKTWLTVSLTDTSDSISTNREMTSFLKKETSIGSKERVSEEEQIVADFANWQKAVQETADEIAQGLYRKVVLARCQVLDLGEGFSLSRTLAYLTQNYPESMTYLYRCKDEVFIGASPEHLVNVTEGTVHIDCLAGSTRRGESPAEDAELGRQLLESPKDLREHRVVVDSVLTAVTGKLSATVVPDRPQLRKLANVQHLYTPVEGQLAGGSVLALVRTLHPTPAVAGQPRHDALRVITKREAVSRGWYAGALGMVTGNDDGHFLVALRCAFIRQGLAYLYAGAGIMGDSDPAQEWQETEWKLKPMQRAMSLQ